jgi:hypothetical protein
MKKKRLKTVRQSDRSGPKRKKESIKQRTLKKNIKVNEKGKERRRKNRRVYRVGTKAERKNIALKEGMIIRDL